MSKNLTRKGLALGTALAFVVTGLTATAPAYAAAGDVVSIAPTTGTGYGAYNTDYLSVTTKADTDVVTSTSLSKLSIKIDNAGQKAVNLVVGQSLTVGTACTSVAYKYFLVDASGNKNTSTTVAAVTGNAASDDSQAACDSATKTAITFSGDYNQVVVYDVATAPSTVVIRFNAVDSATATDHNNVTLGVTSWLDTDQDALLESTDKYPSTTETATFYDAANVTITPRIERFVTGSTAVLNGHGAASLGASLAFSPALNLDQLALGNGITVTTTGGADNTAAAFTPALLAGNTTHSAAGKIYGTVDATDFTLAKATAYSFSAVRANADTAGTGALTFASAGFTVPSQATAGITAATDVLVDQTSDSEQSSATDNAIELRAGVKAFKYTLTGTAAAGAVVSNVPVIAQVTATDLATGSTLTVGSNKLSEGQVALVSGVTDADGKFSVSVESSTAKAGEDYTVIFHALLNSGAYSTVAAGNTFAAAYETAAAKAMTQDSAILAGSTVEAKYTLKDQFGKVISANSAGTAYTVRLQAGDTTKLKKYATFSNGVATISFANYLAKGQSDALTAAIGTGVDTAYADATITTGDTLAASLYNPEAAAAVTTAATLAAQEITYDAFITGAADATTNVAPSANDDFQLTGTVVDTTGAGIPGAVVTVSAKGLQFVKSATSGATYSGDYYKDSITVVADAAGSYEVSVWAHKVSSTGIVITTTSGGKSATTKVVTTGNGATATAGDEITADDLVFTWNAPKHPAVDTTYIVTGKVTDKWGNPISAAEVTVDADGALEVNGNTSVARKTNASGIFRVYFRSLPKVDGIANITATLTKVVVAGSTLDTDAGTAVNATNSTSLDIAAGETFSNVLTSDVNVGVDAAAVAGSKAGTAKVTAYNLNGKTATVYVAGKKVATIKSSAASKSVTVKAAAGAVVKVVVGSTTYFNEAVN